METVIYTYKKTTLTKLEEKLRASLHTNNLHSIKKLHKTLWVTKKRKHAIGLGAFLFPKHNPLNTYIRRCSHKCCTIDVDFSSKTICYINIPILIFNLA